MRWFVEVSRVGDSTPGERYCLDAKAWQAALQETRKLRGDSGPLSKFSIELLDEGYRAVDPVQKIRYFVNQAPNDAPIVTPPLNGSGHGALSSTLPLASPSLAPMMSSAPPPIVSAVPTPLLPSAAPSRAGVYSFTPGIPSVGPAPSSPPPALDSLHARIAMPAAPRPSPRRASKVAVKSEPPVPSAAPAPVALPPPAAVSAVIRASTAVSIPVAAPAAIPAPAAVPAPAPVAAPVPAAIEPNDGLRAAAALPMDSLVAPVNVPPLESPPPSPTAITTPPLGLVHPRAPDSAFEVIASRLQDPTPDAPITYRELACAIAPGASREHVERLLRERWAALKEELNGRPAGKLIQIAIFDHKFQQRPERPPLGTLTWKDWRGDAILGYPAFGEAAPAPTASMPPPPAPAVTPSVAEVKVSAAPAALSANEAAASAPATSVEAAGPAPQDAQAETPAASLPPVAPKKEEQEEPVPLRRPPMGSDPARSSRSKLLLRRRRAGEDLISELFEIMHEVHFARDIASGADFVMGVLDDLIPSEMRMIQVFDINKRSFVVVRARGAGLERALLQRTPDNDSLIVEIMRRGRSRTQRADTDARFSAGRWSCADPRPSSEVLCGPVRQGGRYLGLIELSNPLGGSPYHEAELNALDYICEQFADFVASRPVVLDPDVILNR